MKPGQMYRIRLFCFPYAGGSASTFCSWRNSLPEHIEVVPVELPGRGRRIAIPPFTRMAPLVRALAEDIVPHTNEPFALFGHSMGALVGFELARHLRMLGAAGPICLFVAGRGAPQRSRSNPPLHRLTRKELIEQLRRLKGTPEAMLQNEELMDMALPIIRADLAVLETYSCATEAPLDCPIVAFGGAEDRRLTREDLEAWREQTRSHVAVRVFPGGHFFIRDHTPALLQIIAEAMPLPHMSCRYERHDDRV